MNLENILKTIAKTMPKGVEDKKLRAFLAVRLGFSNQKIEEYLGLLEDLGVIEKNNQGKWVLTGHREEL